MAKILPVPVYTGTTVGGVLSTYTSAVVGEDIDTALSSIARVVNGNLDAANIKPGIKLSVASAASAVPTAWVDKYSLVVVRVPYNGTLNPDGHVICKTPAGFGTWELVSGSFATQVSSGALSVVVDVYRTPAAPVWLGRINVTRLAADTATYTYALSLDGMATIPASSVVYCAANSSALDVANCSISLTFKVLHTSS